MMPDNPKEYNFVERTQQNLHYITNEIETQNIPTNNDQFYEVTNFLNCCLGLISYVYEYTFDHIIATSTTNSPSKQQELVMIELEKIFSTLNYTPEDYGNICLSKSYKKGEKNNICTDMPTLVRHMRNAICHGNMEPMGEKHIESIKFKNIFKGEYRFIACMTISQLEKFANDVATEYLNYKQNKNTKTTQQ